MKALLVSLSAPEIDRLAIELAARGALHGIVRRYANKSRAWERALARLPLLGPTYGATFGRRLPPAGLDAALVEEAGLAADFAAAALSRATRGLPAVAAPCTAWLRAAAERAVAEKGRRLVAGADIVVASYHVALPAFCAARRLGRPTVLNYPIAHHGWQRKFYAALAAERPAFAAALPDFGPAERHTVPLDREIELADTILVGSSFARDTFVAEGVAPDKLRVVPYGADTERFHPGARGEAKPFRVLFVGQIGERKGMSYLLEAYRAFRKSDTELRLVGDYVTGHEVYRADRDLYTHTPNVAQTALPDIYRTADVFVFPTLVEGMGMVVLEAMACGVPVIVTPNGPGDVVRDGVDGFVVPPRDAGALAARLEQLYRDPGLRATLGRNARAGAERWTWARYAESAADAILRGSRGTADDARDLRTAAA